MAHIEKTDKAVERQSRVIKQNRSYFKAQITSLSKFVESFTESKRESIKLQERITRIRSLFQKFNDNQDELGILTEDYDVVELEREEISNAYDEALAAALELQESLSIKPNGNDENVNLYEPKITANKISVNLPNINLPKFDGRIEKWVTFRDAFLSMIDSDKGLSKIQKLTYLTLSLTGEAKESIEAFTISEENYDVVWNHLTEIYNNQRVLVLRHATLLRETPFMKNDSSDAIRELVRHMQLHIRSLEALGRTWEDIANDILTSIVISRMGDETRKAWEHTLIDTEVPKVNDIFKHLHNASHQSQDYASIACMNKPSINMSSRPANKRHTPDRQINRNKLQVPPNIVLADPHFHKPSLVDMLIGTGPTLASFSIGQLQIQSKGKPDLILQKTQFGWVIGGSAPTVSFGNPQTFLSTVDFDLRKFWEIEVGPQQHHLSASENEVESHFIRTVAREHSGRYVVALPFNQKKRDIGESRTQALNRFMSLERRLSRSPDLKTEYTAIINEYITLGHMTQIESPDNSFGFYLPHHAVIKPTSSTTKCRVVFDASAKSDTGISLNDALEVGPTIQDDLFSLLLRFRSHAYVLTGDIEKMYRQFLIRPEDRPYQRILWRNDKNEISTYELKTVTFGVASAPYLAIRSLHQLANDESDNYPAASEVVKRDIYVDDLLTGAATFREALKLRNGIINLLKKGGLNIRQWVSNDPNLLSGLSEDQIHPKYFGDESVKTLGVIWSPRDDSIRYTVSIDNRQTHTKRTILSTIAKIFDPLGLLGPVTVSAKILMQRLWQLRLDWDESLPADIQTEWSNYQAQLRLLKDFAFARHISQHEVKRIEIHGFCDASERAYGANIYLRTISMSGNIAVHLICAKSRVAPLKTISLARLELCGAKLLAELFTNVKQIIRKEIHSTVLWTDSTIVLHWLQRSPNTLKTFVANRVTDIQESTDIKAWRHIRSIDNPADLLSRGCSVKNFMASSLWRYGPSWLKLDETFWPNSHFEIPEVLPELRKLTCLVSTIVEPWEIIDKYSCIRRLTRVIAYCLRFISKPRVTGHLSVKELQRAKEKIILFTQQQSFAQELRDLKTDKQLNSKSKLLPLSPFIDERGILRVGGRLQNSNLPFEQMHPILLPRSSHVTDLIIRESHVQNHHSGLTATLYLVRQLYWPIDGKNITRKIIRQCVKCFRCNPPMTNYVMGNLPAARVLESRPFTNVGVDCCGPFYIKERRYRNRNRVKIYVTVFVCFATKAVHLEVVSDMSSEAFLAALKRFIARRGICRNIYSDNGTNFVGANNEMVDLLRSLSEQEEIRQYVVERKITWHFMPPLSPHFGGLWEAVVKSFKHHLRRVVGDELFTFEQFATFTTEIEAVLNSRPLTPLSSDPNDLSALTPGHFLIGGIMTSVPEADFTKTVTNRLSTWQHIQKIKQDFWSRWHKEYINHLNVRAKWTRGSHYIKEGTIVVLRDDNLPPLQWTLGRVVEIHPGKDDVIRAVTVRTANGAYKRNIRHLAPLPIEPEKS
ncbi:uncharacterized protein LOC143262078 [Megalopta genalis]|uniref:uncharacterized protein LOC143262078 n=1 Tax=Megalopta genalis TaxID=115081 RepID=UPI003FD4F100